MLQLEEVGEIIMCVCRSSGRSACQSWSVLYSGMVIIMCGFGSLSMTVNVDI